MTKKYCFSSVQPFRLCCTWLPDQISHLAMYPWPNGQRFRTTVCVYMNTVFPQFHQRSFQDQWELQKPLTHLAKNVKTTWNSKQMSSNLIARHRFKSRGLLSLCWSIFKNAITDTVCTVWNNVRGIVSLSCPKPTFPETIRNEVNEALSRLTPGLQPLSTETLSDSRVLFHDKKTFSQSILKPKTQRPFPRPQKPNLWCWETKSAVMQIRKEFQEFCKREQRKGVQVLLQLSL